MSSGPYLMTLAEKQERRLKIIELWRGGMQPSDIAKRYGLTANYVRVILSGAGIDVLATTDDRPRADALWDLPDDERRQAIAQRAALAAREQRRANSQALPEVFPAVSHNAQDGGLRG